MADIPDLAKTVMKQNLTYLSASKFKSLFSELARVKMAKVPGNFVEFGIALGGSGICIAAEMDGDREFRGFDVFGMIPPPGKVDGSKPNQRYEIIKSGRSEGIGGDKYYGYIDNLEDAVKANFERFGLHVDGKRIAFVKGRFEETLVPATDAPIAFAHVDCDWYESVRCCLAFLERNLSPGGVMIFDDYNDWDGCRKAVDEFLSQARGFTALRRSPHAVIMKKS